jgi:site-specific recombinase XerD
MRQQYRRIAKGVYRDKYNIRAVAKVGTGDNAQQRWKRFPPDTQIADIKAWQEAQRPELRRAVGKPDVPQGTLAEDVKAYLAQVATLASYKSRKCEMDAWTELYGQMKRSDLTPAHVREARAKWAKADYKPKTINNRCQSLRHLFHVLDGKRALTPVDEVDKLPVPESVKVLVPAEVFRTVAENLKDSDPKTRGRFMVIASTGCRPSELKRAERGDVDLSRKIWTVRTGKGGEMRALFLNAEMVTAWEAFIGVDGWGDFDASDYAKTLYAAGWPKTVRPYQARHSVAIELGERGVDLADVSGVLGHKDLTTTRKHYQPILSSRLKKASEALAGRFEGWAPVPAAESDKVH